MNREYDEVSKDKKHTQMSKFRHSARSQQLINELNSMYGKTKDKIQELIESLRQDNRKDHEIKKILLNEVKFMSRASIYNALPEDLKREYTKTISLSTKHKVINVDTEEDFELPSNLPVTSPETIIMKSEGEIAAEQYLSDQNAIQELKVKTAEISDLIKNHIITEEQIHKFIGDQYLETFQIPKDINITMGAYHARLSPIQAVIQIKQLQNSVKTLEIGWRIIG